MTFEFQSQRLNPAQLEAIGVVDGPLLVLAGPGSGKTAVITHRIAHLIEQGIPSGQIVALTFTNKAADEMKARVQRLVDGHFVWMGTFHKFCARLLRTYAPSVGLLENFTIYDTSDSRTAMRDAFEQVGLNRKQVSLESIADRIAEAKHRAVDVESFRPRPGHAQDAVVAKVYRAYQQTLQRANAVDFDDLLLHVFVLLRDNPELRESLDERYRYILVDEYQDTNMTQYAIVRALSLRHPNLCVTGDPDQSIYGWRGANLDNILRFERDFPGARTVRLEQNYRSTKAILRVADQLIQNNRRRLSKGLHTENDEGVPVRLVAYPSPRQEAADIADAIQVALQNRGRAPGDFALLYRANWLSRSFEHELRSRRIPYTIVHGHEFYQRREIKDVFAYLHLINNARDNVAIQRIINVPPRKIGKATLDKLRVDAVDRGDAILEAARRCGLNTAISKAAAAKVAGFVAIYDRLCEFRHEPSMRQLIERVLEITGYREYLLEEDPEGGHERVANIDELLVAADEFDEQHPDDGGLEAFLESAALVNDVDEWNEASPAVSLMTLHAAKGLEFPVVFIVGLEDGLLPHERSSQDEESLEEERRLLFVGITRAKEELQLSRTVSRIRRGESWPTIASRFLMELPRGEMDVFGPTSYEFYGVDEDLPHVDDDFDWETGESQAANRPGARDRRDVSHEEAGEADADLVEESAPAYRATPAKFRLVTASQLAEPAAPKESRNRERYPVDLFSVGMLVEHPDYGAGVIQQLNGTGDKKVAQVDFGGDQHSFRLAHSPLRPVGVKR